MIGNAIHSNYFTDFHFIVDYNFKLTMKEELTILDLNEFNNDIYLKLNQLADKNLKIENVSEIVTLIKDKCGFPNKIKTKLFSNKLLLDNQDRLIFINSFLEYFSYEYTEIINQIRQGLK